MRWITLLTRSGSHVGKNAVKGDIESRQEQLSRTTRADTYMLLPRQVCRGQSDCWTYEVVVPFTICKDRKELNRNQHFVEDLLHCHS